MLVIDTPVPIIDMWLLAIELTLLSGDRCGETAVHSPPSLEEGTTPCAGWASCCSAWGTLFINWFAAAVSMANNHMSMMGTGVSMTNTLHSMLKGLAPAAAQAVETAAQNGVWAMSSLGSQLGSSLGSSGLGAGVAANLGRAASVGSLSVPPAWAAANQAVTPAARALPLTSLTSAAQTAPGHMLGGLPLGHSVNAGSGINNALRVPARAYAIPRTPAAG
ncbi:PE family protein [Mycobacterium tuberculosis]|nr:PE family protein [Mycobacterium tuberculosis]